VGVQHYLVVHDNFTVIYYGTKPAVNVISHFSTVNEGVWLDTLSHAFSSYGTGSKNATKRKPRPHFVIGRVERWRVVGCQQLSTLEIFRHTGSVELEGVWEAHSLPVHTLNVLYRRTVVQKNLSYPWLVLYRRTSLIHGLWDQMVPRT